MNIPPVRFAEGSDDIVEGLAIPYGGPFPGNVDFYRTRFDSADLCLDWFPSRPVLYHHGQDPEVRASVIGTVATPDITDYDDGTRKGKWIRAQLDKRHEYFDAIRDLVTRGALGWSHGTIDYLVNADPPARDGTRNIRQWPVAEFTLTPVEANPDAFVVAHTMRSADAEAVLELLGTTSDEVSVRGWLPEGTTQGDLDDGDFAWISDDKTLPDSERRKLPYKVHGKVNEAGWKAAWSRAHQDGTDFAGGPSQADVIKKLLADAPPGVETKYDDGKEPLPGRSARRDSDAANDAACGAGILGQLVALIGEEADEPAQVAMLQRAADALTQWIAAERAEIGTAADTDDDAWPTMMSARAGARNSAADLSHINAIHDHAVALGATAHLSPDDAPEDETDDETNDDAAPARSAEPGPVVLTVMSDADAAVRAAALAKAEEVGRAKALTFLG